MKNKITYLWKNRENILACRRGLGLYEDADIRYEKE